MTRKENNWALTESLRVKADRAKGLTGVTRQSQSILLLKQGFVYIMTNRAHTVLYTGVTSDLVGRVYQHRNGLIDGFTKRYNVRKLVYYEVADCILTAIQREKQIKSGSRRHKMRLIDTMNPEWLDLNDTL